MKEIAVSALCLVALAVAGKLGQSIQPQLKAPVGMTLHQQEELEESAVSSLFGEFRASMADFLWLEADRYLHFGIATRGRLDAEKNDKKVGAVQGTASHDSHHDETTVVPSAQSDWRGLLGSLERQTQPYMDMSNHTERNPKEALPLFRLMTWSNPQFVQGYVYGATQMASLPDKKAEALAFLKEGERNNPESISIQSTLCEFYLVHRQKPQEAEPYGRQALSLFARKDLQTLSEDEKDDANSAFRWLVLIYRNQADEKAAQGESQQAQALYAAGRIVAQECLRHFPEDPTASLFLSKYAGK